MKSFFTQTFPGFSEQVRQIKFNNRLSALVDQGYAGAWVASNLTKFGAFVSKTEGPVPMMYTIHMVEKELYTMYRNIFGKEPIFSNIEIVDKKAYAFFNHEIYFEIEITDRQFMCMSIDRRVTDQMTEYMKVVQGQSIKASTIVLTDQGIGVDTKELDVNKMRLPHRLFYPYLDEPMEDIWEDFMASTSNLMITYGPAGTGKTTFGRGMAVAHAPSVYLAINSKVFQAADPFSPYYSDKLSPLLIAEEMDSFLGPRQDDGQHSGVVAALLNQTQGFADETHKKVLLVTNLTSPVSQIDEALMRPGRCHSVTKFRNLTHLEACHLAEEMKIQAFLEAEKRDHWSLAEVLNFKKTRNNNQGHVVGFV